MAKDRLAAGLSAGPCNRSDGSAENPLAGSSATFAGFPGLSSTGYILSGRGRGESIERRCDASEVRRQDRSRSRHRAIVRVHRRVGRCRACRRGAVLSPRIRSGFSRGHLCGHAGHHAGCIRLSPDGWPQQGPRPCGRHADARQDRPFSRIHSQSFAREARGVGGCRWRAMLRSRKSSVRATACARAGAPVWTRLRQGWNVSDSGLDQGHSGLPDSAAHRYAVEGDHRAALSAARRLDQTYRHDFS